jgi:transcriptional regulator GlxA family with amidase domain
LINKLRQATVLEDKPVDIQSQDEKFILNITQIIEDRLAEPDLNVQYLADSTGISAKQVYRKIKLLTGHTAVDYIKFIRLKKAAILLGQKKFTIAEVMYMVGFSNHSYFSKCFSEKYGKTPKEFMESTDS